MNASRETGSYDTECALLPVVTEARTWCVEPSMMNSVGVQGAFAPGETAASVGVRGAF